MIANLFQLFQNGGKRGNLQYFKQKINFGKALRLKLKKKIFF